MRPRFQHTLNEPAELEEKRSELKELRTRHVAAHVALQQLRDGIDEFRRYCDETLALRLAVLDTVENEINRLTHPLRDLHHCSGCSPSDLQADQFFMPRDLKSLYRAVAKAVHPDVASAKVVHLNRHELMSKANRAYAAEDWQTLREILRRWRRVQGLAEEDETGPEVMDRLIQRERLDLETINAEVDAVRRSCAWRLKLRADRSLQSRDLTADMIAIADLSIAGALRKLAVLKGGKKEGRKLHFPAGVACGTLYVRDAASANFTKWRKAGDATGCLEVEKGQAVRLDVEGEALESVAALQKLEEGDLQSLFLYGATDGDVSKVVHLSGLQELYLSGAGVTDAALAMISSLKNLKRLYIYQTAISDRGLLHLTNLPLLAGLTSSGNPVTDEGLARLRQSLPALRIVTFQWNR